jgi:hypothetical protein
MINESKSSSFYFKTKFYVKPVQGRHALFLVLLSYVSFIDKKRNTSVQIFTDFHPWERIRNNSVWHWLLNFVCWEKWNFWQLILFYIWIFPWDIYLHNSPNRMSGWKSFTYRLRKELDVKVLFRDWDRTRQHLEMGPILLLLLEVLETTLYPTN